MGDEYGDLRERLEEFDGVAKDVLAFLKSELKGKDWNVVTLLALWSHLYLNTIDVAREDGIDANVVMTMHDLVDTTVRQKVYKESNTTVH